MKKKLLIVACLLPLFAANSVAQTKTDWEEMNLKGKVKSLKETEYIVSSKDSVDCAAFYAAFLRCELDYNKLISLADSVCGDKIEHYDKYYEFDSLGHYVISWTGVRMRYQYDKEGRMLEKNKEVDGIPINTVVYKYNDNGQLTDEKQGDEATHIVYDNHGNVVERITKIGDSVVEFVKIKYDKQGRPRKAKGYSPYSISNGPRYFINMLDSKGNFIFRYVKVSNRIDRSTSHYLYDRNDSVVGIRGKTIVKFHKLETGDSNYGQVIDSNDIVTNAVDYKVDNQKRKTKSKWKLKSVRNEHGYEIKVEWNDDDFSQTTIYERDNQDRIIKMEQYSYDTIPEVIVKYEYDDKGRKIGENSERYYHWDHTIRKHKYVWEYDEKGNNTKYSGFFGENLEHDFDYFYFYDNQDNYQIVISNKYQNGNHDSSHLWVRKIEYY